MATTGTSGGETGAAVGAAAGAAAVEAAGAGAEGVAAGHSRQHHSFARTKKTDASSERITKMPSQPSGAGGWGVAIWPALSTTTTTTPAATTSEKAVNGYGSQQAANFPFAQDISLSLSLFAL